MSGQTSNDGPPPGSSSPPAPPPLMNPANQVSGPTNAKAAPSFVQAHASHSRLPPVPQLRTTGITSAGGGGSVSSSSLPPPPKFPSTISSNTNPTPAPVVTSGASVSSSSSLPPPPKFSVPISVNSGSNISVESNASNNSNIANGSNDNRFTSRDKKNQRGKTMEPIHATTEQIPPLASAPNSGGSLTKEVLGFNEEPADDNIGASNNATSASSFFAAPAPAAPSSGNWSQWGGSLIEKAGQLAYSTVGSAVDLVGVEENAAAYYNGVNGAAENNVGYSQESPLPPAEAERETSIIDMATPDPGLHPSLDPRKAFPQPPLTNHSGAANKNKLAPAPVSTQDEDQGIEIGADGRAPSASPLRSPTASVAVRVNSTPIPSMISQQEKEKQPRKRALANPPLSTLAARQSHLTVLVVPTADAQSIATKNNTTLTEMFRVFGNSNAHSAPNTRGLDPETSPQNTADSSLEPPLPPFRSANRSMMLHWDQIVLDFVLGQDMEDMPVAEADAEKALGEAARLWDEDRFLSGGTSGHFEEDPEMNQLENCVAEALADEEEEERIRKADGIPSMTSLPPPRSLKQTGSKGEDADGKDHQYATAFDDNGEEPLDACANAAFALTSLPAAPWLTRFRHTLDCSTDGMSHDMLCNPAVAILVSSTSEPFLNCFAELANVHHLPRPFHDGRYDPNGVRREFLLLHDVCDGPKHFDEARALAQMRERFGPGCCSVLRINSEPQMADPTAGEDLEWENFEPSSPFIRGRLSDGYKSSIRGAISPIRGGCLSLQDKRAIRRYIANMVATGLIPAIERRIANLNSAVTNAKKGVKNVIKSFWRKPKENIIANVSGYDANIGRKNSSNNLAGDGSVRYRFDSIECQTRLLADTLFLMRDYDAALGVYKLVKDDYKHDKAMLHYASSQEMIVLCMHMLDPYGKESRFASEVHHSIETALYSYTRAADDEREAERNSGARPGEAPHATRLATRLCLVLSAARALCEGKHMEIADLLASASSHETPLGAAVLLEQSSSHYYRAGMLRKYAFHLLMAGHMFRSAGQERHAFRCFSASLYVYHGERWEELRSHLRSALAAQLYGMGRYALSMQFYAKLISMTGGGRVSVRSQQKFLNHVIDICKGHQPSALLAVDRMNKSAGGATSGESSTSIADILKAFSNAARMVEITNIDFPCVKDSSITVRVENTSDSSALFGHSDSISANASSSKGDESIWENMMNCAEAELRASVVSSAAESVEQPSNEGGPAPPPIHSGNETIDRVIREIDKEERDAEYRARLKRKGNLSTPEVRATSEPLAVSFSLSNPLGIDIDLTDVQLVASLACRKTGMMHTSEHSVSPQNDLDSSIGKMKFHGSDKEYSRPEFLCQLPITSDPLDTQTPGTGGTSKPYFVVTKSALRMKSNTESTITLNICPLAEGDFKILGVRFKLLGEVWIYHRFALSGPLLQDSQLNRARRARGESLLLNSKVEREMPFLQVSITPNRTDPNSQGVVLQGQTSSWTLKLSNLGYAPARNIMLKTNSPWLNIDNSSEALGQSENSSTSFCIGPSGTLMRIPFKTATGSTNFDNSDMLGILKPGETAEVPVVIRTSGGGRQEFFMLVRYELWCKEYLSSNLIPRHRWARKLLSLPVYPSITMSASLMPSYSNKGEHILSVELMNYRSDRDTDLEIYLDKIFIASRHFQVRQMMGQIDTDNQSGSLIPTTGSVSAISSLKIGWQERVTLHYLVIPLEETNPSFTLSMLSFSNGGQADSETLHEITQRYGGRVTDFMCRERAHDVFNSSLRAHKVEKERLLALQEKEGQPRHVAQIRRARTSMPTEESNSMGTSGHPSPGSGSAALSPLSPVHPTSIASLCPINGSSNINIICCWSAQVGKEAIDESIHGQHHLRSLLVRPQNKSKGCPLALTAKHATKVSHDFNAGPLDVEVEVTMRNRLVENKVEFEFALDHQPSFDFVGATCFKWTLSGGEEITVPLKARFYCRGVYNLQSVRLTVIKADLAVPYLFPLQWTIEVEDEG